MQPIQLRSPGFEVGRRGVQSRVAEANMSDRML